MRVNMQRLKSLIIISIVSAFVFYSCGKKEVQQKFSYSPTNPKPGYELTVSYNSDSTNLSKAKKIDMIVYQYKVDIDTVLSVKMNKKNNRWVGSFNTTDSTRGAVIEFQAGDEIDNNNKDGYIIKMTDGKNLVPGADAGLAVAYAQWMRILDIDLNYEKAYSLFNDDFNKHPSIKNEYLGDYFDTLLRIYPETWKDTIKTDLDKLELQKKLNENDYALLTLWYQRTGNFKKAGKYKNISIKKYPKGTVAQFEEYIKFKRATNIDEKIKLINEFKKSFPKSNSLENMSVDIIKRYLVKQKFKDAEKFMSAHSSEIHPYYFSFIASKIIKGNKSLKLAAQIAALGIKRAEENVNKPASEKPKYITLQEWHNQNDYYLGLNIYYHSEAEYRLGNKKGILEQLKKAVDLTSQYYRKPLLDQFYSTVLFKQGKYKKTMDFISKLVSKGAATDQMKSILKDTYKKVNGSDKGYIDYLSKFEKEANKSLIKELKKEMINKPAPDFTLTDINGKKVTLSKLRGKTVIVDFWASWCGPCKSSFPGMKKLVEKYADDKSVEFLFVNTWENLSNKAENAKKFITENNYPFEVLIDKNNSVVKKYKVSGIPTKFIIDKKGNIRFKKVGFSGTADHLVNEVSEMISLVQ